MGDTAQFSAGLLNPLHPVPSLIKGQIERRYAVYRNNVTVGLIRALEANFPAVRRLLGADYFAGFARDFAQAHPPQSPLMFGYGVDFPKALESSADLAAYPFLADVARLEILWRQSYHAADAHSLAADALATIDAEALFTCHFSAHPATRLLRSEFAVHDIFQTNRTDGAAFDGDPAQPQCVLVTRPQFNVGLAAITGSQFVFFDQLVAGKTLGDALDCVPENAEDFDLSSTVALLLQSGAFQSINTK